MFWGLFFYVLLFFLGTMKLGCNKTHTGESREECGLGGKGGGV
jgi:hypothetical protein